MADEAQLEFFRYFIDNNLGKSAIKQYYRIRGIPFPRVYGVMIRLLTTVELKKVLKQATHELLGGSPMADTDGLGMINLTEPMTADALFSFYVNQGMWRLVGIVLVMLLSLYGGNWVPKEIVQALVAAIESLMDRG